MLDTVLFEQRRSKVTHALERAKMSMMNEEDDKTVRPLLRQVGMIERTNPEDTREAIPGANQVPVMLSIRTQEEQGYYYADLSGAWIDETHSDVMIPWIVDWLREGIRSGKLPAA